jgi:two-component system, LytTR family, sensor kinase
MTRPLRHLIFWIVYLLINVRLQSFNPDDNLLNLLLSELYVMPPKIALTYFVFYWIIPRYFKKDNPFFLTFQLIACFFLSIFIYRLIIINVVLPQFYLELVGKKSWFDTRLIWWTGWDVFITVAAASTIKLFRLYNKSQQHEQELTQQKLQSELNFLRAQTNPHFLFNTLNNLYGLARRKSDKTAESILTLSKIMRFVLNDCRQQFIPVSKEVAVIEDYIILEKLRYHDRLTVVFEKEIEDENQPIAPLLLLPFVENAFKHGGKGTTGDANIFIKIESSENKIYFEVKNNLEADSPREPTGIGLKNVRRQLELTYPDCHFLEIKPTENAFLVQLSIDLLIK